MKRTLGLLLITVGICGAQANNVTIAYGTGGLTKLTYNGFQYLSAGMFGVNAVNFVNGAGQVSAGSTSGTTSYDPAHLRTTIKYSWGRVVVGYAVSGNKLSLTITTVNASALTIQGVFYEPMDLQFPSAPQEFDGTDPIIVINNGKPTALRLTAGANALVLANDDVVQPLLVGFPWSLNKPANTIFPVKVETSQDTMLPNSIPFVNRPIPPGTSDTYHISFRFGAAAATTKSLVADVYQSFATIYPFTVKWTDHRPIGQLIIGSTATGFATNPRGWFNDPTVDVTTPQGVAAFQARLLAWAQNSVTILKSMNAQGMVTWDIEGEQYPQPTTYIGDPTLFGTLAPEMNGVIDQYFQTFSNAGFRVGVCLRPQQLVIPPGGGAPTQTTVADPTQLLLTKVAYAYNRWGATLFYIDSNGDPNFPISSSFFKTVAAQYPNVLLIPEHETTSYYGFGSWYGENRGGVTGTPQAVLDVYPGAFSVIYLPDGPFQQDQALLQASANRGDIMMFRAWYTDPQNSDILNLYPSNGVAAPAPGIATPSNNSTVSGTVTVTTTVAAGPAGIAGVQYVLDGGNVGAALSAPPYAYALNTGTLAGGLHQLQAIATDTLGDLSFAVSNFFVSAAAVNQPPLLSFTAPINIVVSGESAASVNVADSVPLSSVQFMLDGAALGPALTNLPYLVYFDSFTVSSGAHTLRAIATDQNGVTGQASDPITVQNTPLGIALTAPVAGSVVAQSVAITATVTGSALLSGVQFAVDGVNTGSLDAATPFATEWMSQAAANGAHTLTATVYDIFGNSAVSSVGITVQNAAGVSFLTGSPEVTAGSQNLTAVGSSDWIHWGLNGATWVDRKANVVAQISNFGVTGSGSVAAYANNPFAFKWSDGAPTAVEAGTTTGLYVIGQNNGFTLSAPAGTFPQTLTVYTGVYKAQALVTAQLSDFSAPVYQDASTVNLSGQTSVAYTLSYQAGSSGQSLAVTVTQQGKGTDPYSNVTLQAATLSAMGAQGALTGEVSRSAGTQDLTALGTADWERWSGTAATAVERKAGVSAQISGLTRVGVTGGTTEVEGLAGFSWTDGAVTRDGVSAESGVSATGNGSGFSVTAPADREWRTLTFYAGLNGTRGRLTATLSDRSAPTWSDDSVTASGGRVAARYTLHYRAAHAGQTLTIGYLAEGAESGGAAGVSVEAATLSLQ